MKCLNCGSFGHYGRDCRDKWSGDKAKGKSRESKGNQGRKGQLKSKGKGQGKLNSVARAERVDGWLEEGTSQSHHEQDTEHVDECRDEEDSDGWWKSSDSHGW